ncbi:MAG: hypothetical protein KGL93_05925 [Gemmatimonadota bacterium]|nr:hypothetical protein [Gemmatimonadota bacterium]HEU4990100.1 hypothetical protein [Gemmatimonadaceae bacterium]
MRAEDMIVALGGLLLVGYVFRSIVGLISRRLDAKSARALPPEADQRLARIEQAVDAIALEVERISEGQRFTTRLLADRAQVPTASAPKPPVQS